jgi:single-stranded DNA-binding protein
MNNVSLFGELDSEPELLGMPGRGACEFWLAVNGRREKKTLYVRVVALRGLGERLGEELSKGDSVAVTGHLRSEPWPGSRRLYRHSVLARDVEALGESVAEGSG